jgi:hypothetical protein
MRFPLCGLPTLALGAVVACSSTDPRPPEGVSLSTNATTYALTTPPTTMTLSVHNNTTGFIQIPVCGLPPTLVAQVVWEQQQPDKSWAPAPYLTPTCDSTEFFMFTVPPNTVSPVPPARLLPATVAGTYRVKLGWAHYFAVVQDSATSNAYVVTGP